MTVGDVATVARGLALAEVQVAKKWRTQVLGARGVLMGCRGNLRTQCRGCHGGTYGCCGEECPEPHDDSPSRQLTLCCPPGTWQSRLNTPVVGVVIRRYSVAAPAAMTGPRT